MHELFAAIEAGDREAVGRLLEQGADLDQRLNLLHDHGPFYHGLTPLIVACMVPGERAWAVEALLKAGADPYAVSAGEATALWYAAGGGIYPKSILEPSEEETEWVRQSGDYAERLRLLLQAGAYADETADNGRSAFSEACETGDPERVRMLLEAGVGVVPNEQSVRDSQQDTATMTEELIQQSLPDLPGPRSLKKKVADQMRQVLRGTGGPPSFQIPLHQAAESGSAECVRLLLEAGAPPDLLDDRGRSALFYAGSEEVARVLLDAGIDPRSQDQFGQTALEAAFEEERYDVAAVLLKVSGDLNAPKKGWTPLHSAAFRIQPKAVRALVEAGADPLATTEDGQTALHLAAWQGDSSWDGDRNEAIREMVRLLVEYGIDPNVRNRRGQTPLFDAVFGDWESVPATWELLQLGADPDARDKEGRTPLMEAAEHGEVKCIQVLLAAGADPKIRDRSGSTALDYAKRHLGIWKKITLGKRLFRREVPDHQRQALEEAEECVRLLGGASSA